MTNVTYNKSHIRMLQYHISWWSHITSMEVSQMVTYWFVIAWFDNQSVQKSKVKQAAKDIVKSEVHPQTYSP